MKRLKLLLWPPKTRILWYVYETFLILIFSICVNVLSRVRLINVCFLFYKALQKENAELREMLNVVHEQLELALSANKVQKQNLDTLNARLAGYIQDLVTVHREITNTLQT